MAKRTPTNAWEDDWEAQADRAASEDKETGGAPLHEEEPVILSRAERLAKHKEEQRRLWKSADEPEDFPFLAVTSTVPAGTVSLKPAMKLLSRKPAPQVIKRRDPVTGLEKLTIRDDDAEAAAEAEAEAARNKLTPEQVRLRQQREREAKQRKYDEARAKIFGEPLPPKKSASTASTALTASTAPVSGVPSPVLSASSGHGTHSPSHGRGRGRGRGNNNNNNNRRQQQQPQQPSPAQPSGTSKELYDPSYQLRPVLNQRRAAGSGSGSDVAWSPLSSRSGTPREDDYVIRAPRGPDGSGRGGFGFARRGG